METISKIFSVLIAIVLLASCTDNKPKKDLTAAEILGNPDYLAISYSGLREISRDSQPTIDQIKEDMKILAAMNVKILRTYDAESVFAPNVLEAISQLKKEDKDFEMYVMLGAWINCENAWTANPNHEVESAETNKLEMERIVALAKKYPDIVKIIAVGNEAMVHWATSYFVKPGVILKWVNYLQELKKSGELSSNLWITSSDNFASWGGADASYHVEDLTKLIQAVDYVSLHTYPFHDSHYNADYWLTPKEEEGLSEIEKIDAAMLRAKKHAMDQYQSTANYIKSLGIEKPIHIGETGWSSSSDGFYGNEGSKAADEYKSGLFYRHMRDWTNEIKIACFYFEAFDEQWKDASNPLGSENHFGLFTLDGQAKYALWELVENGSFNGLTRGGNPISKTYNGNKELMMKEVFAPPLASEKKQ